MMPIRFPTEAANDPDGPIDGLPEATGEDDVDALRGPDGKPAGGRSRPEREPGRDAPRDPDAGKS